MAEFESDIIRSLQRPGAEGTNPVDIYRVDIDGVVVSSPEAARNLYDVLQTYPTPRPKKKDYDPTTGLHKDAQSYTLATSDGGVALTLTNHGAMATGYRVGEREILYPPRPAGTPFTPGDTLRGAGLICHPHNCEDARVSPEGKQVNYHGTLARSFAIPVHIDEQEGIAIFALTSNLIPDNIPHDPNDGMLTLVSYKLQDDGSYTTTVQTFNFGENPLYTGDAFHPYFDTRRSHAIGLRVGDHFCDFSQYREHNKMSVDDGLAELKKAVFDAMSMYQDGDAFPSLTLYTPKYTVTLAPLIGFDPARASVGIWTEKYVKFFCLEVVEGQDAAYNPDDPAKIPSYTEIQPGESSLLAVRIKAELA